MRGINVWLTDRKKKYIFFFVESLSEESARFFIWVTRLELVWIIPSRPKRDLTTNSSIPIKVYIYLALNTTWGATEKYFVCFTHFYIREQSKKYFFLLLEANASPLIHNYELKIAQDKIRTYNLNIFRVPLNQLSFLSYI